MGGSDWKVFERDVRVADSKKTGLGGQASPKRRRSRAITVALMGLAQGLGACGDHGGEGKDCPTTARTSPVSGFCVPRYVSLKRERVYARKGPGTDYPALWVYRARGLPVQVVEETLDWRRVCDPYGGAAWIHKSMVDGRRTVETLGDAPLPLLQRPGAGGRPRGLLNARVLASLDRCQGDWCRVSVGGASGWVPSGRIWGAAPTAQCR